MCNPCPICVLLAGRGAMYTDDTWCSACTKFRHTASSVATPMRGVWYQLENIYENRPAHSHRTRWNGRPLRYTRAMSYCVSLPIVLAVARVLFLAGANWKRFTCRSLVCLMAHRPYGFEGWHYIVARKSCTFTNKTKLGLEPFENELLDFMAIF